jgi:DNA-directed RNA polymerase subunit RPC12/RpoP
MTTQSLYRCKRCGATVPQKALAVHAERCSLNRTGVARRARANPKADEPEYSIGGLQFKAAAEGRQWLELPCMQCGKTVAIHVEWEKPTPRCESCRKRDGKKKIARIVSGGLPTLGKRK